MISNVDLIRDALGLLGVLAENEAPTAGQAQHGLRVLNEMLADWEGNGVNLGYTPGTSLADNAALDDMSIQPVKYNLAHELAPYYGRPTPPEVFERAQRGYARLLRDAVNLANEEVEITLLPAGSARYWHSEDEI